MRRPRVARLMVSPPRGRVAALRRRRSAGTSIGRFRPPSSGLDDLLLRFEASFGPDRWWVGGFVRDGLCWSGTCDDVRAVRDPKRGPISVGRRLVSDAFDVVARMAPGGEAVVWVNGFRRRGRNFAFGGGARCHTCARGRRGAPGGPVGSGERGQGGDDDTFGQAGEEGGGAPSVIGDAVAVGVGYAFDEAFEPEAAQVVGGLGRR